jgi:hypothetical protein
VEEGRERGEVVDKERGVKGGIAVLDRDKRSRQRNGRAKVVWRTRAFLSWYRNGLGK